MASPHLEEALHLPTELFNSLRRGFAIFGVWIHGDDLHVSCLPVWYRLGLRFKSHRLIECSELFATLKPLDYLCALQTSLFAG